ncbi:anaerobic ribonucleoside-triphosphate reductase activating protein [Ruminococcaceae bacterium OttesenSCG-928-A16]|nr:anaerobic ribonucleoside-triphosphate reductase activating protein [Ruminococcaceae bacterium OttesenSCG-928-A16]
MNHATDFASENDLTLSLFGFEGDSIVDGPGLRCAIFTQGCPHACQGCHNPASHPFTGGQISTVSQLYTRIKSYPLCSGVTFSGGEPFCQAEALAALAQLLKADGLELAAYTGYTFEELLQGTPAQQKLLGMLNTLIDGRFELAQRDLTLRFRGSANQRILQVPQSLAAGTPVWETAPRWVGGGKP